MCSNAECGPGPKTPTILCPDGSTAGPVCQRNPDGRCGWIITMCPTPPPCPPIRCLAACPNGYVTDANGCQTCQCLPPPAACNSYTDYSSCQGDMRCTWLAPGCGEPALPAQGCYARSDVNCTSDASCTPGHVCLKRVVNPCFAPNAAGATCAACGVTQTICL
jgi:hypothetical protein